MIPTLLQINTVVNSGSTGRIAEEIGQVALAAGWRSIIAYGRNPRPSKSELIRVGSNFDVYVHAAMSRIFDDEWLGSTCATQKFIQKIEELKPDIVHLHNMHGYYLNTELLFKYLAKTGIPVVWTLHDCLSFTGHCSHFTVAKCDKWKTGCFACPQKRGYPTSYVFDRSRKNWEGKRALFSPVKNLTLVPVSHWLEGLVKESFLGDKNIQAIYNGVDTSVFFPRTQDEQNAIREKYKIGSRFMAMGCATSWSESKGLSDFYRLRERLNDDYTIVLVGLTQKQLAELPKGIIGIARTESVQELAGLYSTADIVLNPTYEDNFPTINIESLACGTPVCTYKTGGSPEALNIDTGFVVDVGDIDGVISAIEQVRSRGKSFYSEQCRSRALNCFKKEDRYTEYLELYERLLSNFS